MKIKCEQINLTVIAIYSPVNPSTKILAEKPDEFYADLQDTIDKVPHNNMIVLLRNFNARIWQHQHKTATKSVGSFTVDFENENGIRLVNLYPSFIDQISIPTIPTKEEDRQDKPPTIQEVQEALKQMKNKKTLGND
ncbi:unnamed protein product [Rotaria sp. Silwood2]|nr:unnamed protein product [Rotaria sp. Silwood2]